MQYTYGSVYPFTATFRLADGTLASAVTSPIAHLIAPDDSTLDVDMELLEAGKYKADWTVPEGWPIGVTRFCYQGTFAGGTWSSDEDSFTVVAPGGIVTPGTRDTPYSTPDDLRALRLTDLTTSDMSDEVVRAHIESADAYIDACLDNRYVVPFETPIPPLIKHLSLDLAAASIVRYTHAGEGAATELPLYVRFRAQAKEILDQIIGGTLVLPGLAQQAGITVATYRDSGLPSPLQQFDLYTVPQSWRPPSRWPNV